jgi:hypothetical protein
MTTLVLEADPEARNIHIEGGKLLVQLTDGRELSVPLEWYPRLLHATEDERNNWTLLGDGYAIEWPDLDEHVGIEGLLAGRHSGESAESFERWLQSRA